MKEIYGVHQVANTNDKQFHNDLCAAINLLQKDGQELEIQYSTNISNDNVVLFSALVLGRKDK